MRFRYSPSRELYRVAKAAIEEGLAAVPEILQMAELPAEDPGQNLKRARELREQAVGSPAPPLLIPKGFIQINPRKGPAHIVALSTIQAVLPGPGTSPGLARVVINEIPTVIMESYDEFLALMVAAQERSTP